MSHTLPAGTSRICFDICADELLHGVSGDPNWTTYLQQAVKLQQIDFHLAIMCEPFYGSIINGTKTVESRFSRNRCAPYQAVAEGDVIMFKKVCEPISALSRVERVWYYDLRLTPLEQIIESHANEIAADDAFWEQQSESIYASLMLLTETIKIPPIECSKRDRRGWVSLSTRQGRLEL